VVISGCTDQMIICADCTKIIYRSEYDEDNCCVPNPYYDPNSNNPYRVDSVLSVNLDLKRVRNLPAQLLMAPCPWDIFKKRIPFIEAARRTRKASSDSINAAKAAAAAAKVAAAVEESGDTIPYTEAELSSGLCKFKIILTRANQPSRDILMVNKVSKVGADILREESERKLFDPKACFVVTSTGHSAGKGDGTFVITRVGSVDDLINEVEKARADTVTLPLSYTYVDLERSTDKDSACELEKQCQDYCNAIRLSNHTEDEAYHKGSSSKKTPYAGACAGLVVDSLRAVQQGLLFFNSSMQPVLKTRILTNYPWARDKKYWRKEATGARERDLAKTRARNEARKKKKAAALLEADANAKKKKAA